MKMAKISDTNEKCTRERLQKNAVETHAKWSSQKKITYAFEIAHSLLVNRPIYFAHLLC